MAVDDSNKRAAIDRRSFMGAATLGAGAAAAGLGAAGEARAEVLFPPERMGFGGGGSAAGAVNRSENDLYDCEVEGKLPADLDGVFYRVGPDPQYPKAPKNQGDIGFDGEGHVSMFRIKDGHVDFRSRYAKNQRWKAQHAARRSLFGMYRNPLTDDPSVKGLSRGTANTQIWYNNGLLLALKEDSPPVAMDPLTLETVDDYHTFGGGLKGQTFTAHPKNDPHTGEMIAFGYEAKGFGSNDIEVVSVNPQGKVTWSAWVKSPYTCMIHDFAVTERHIAFLAIPLAFNKDGIPRGEVHWAWDGALSPYLGVMRRGGDGKDIRWVKGPMTMCTHTMGAWSDGEKVYVDMDGGDGNQFPFFPSHAEPFDPVKAQGRVRRFSMDLSNRNNESFDMQVMYPQITGALARQDDRYHTLHYRYGFLLSSDRVKGAQWVMFDHQTAATKAFGLGPDVQLAEMCFVPRKKDAPEGDGYLIGVANRTKENGRSDLVLVDTQHLDAGPIATVKMPYRVPGQIHGLWISGDQLPPARAA